MLLKKSSQRTPTKPEICLNNEAQAFHDRLVPQKSGGCGGRPHPLLCGNLRTGNLDPLSGGDAAFRCHGLGRLRYLTKRGATEKGNSSDSEIRERSQKRGPAIEFIDVSSPHAQNPGVLWSGSQDSNIKNGCQRRSIEKEKLCPRLSHLVSSMRFGLEPMTRIELVNY